MSESKKTQTKSGASSKTGSGKAKTQNTKSAAKASTKSTSSNTKAASNKAASSKASSSKASSSKASSSKETPKNYAASKTSTKSTATKSTATVAAEKTSASTKTKKAKKRDSSNFTSKDDLRDKIATLSKRNRKLTIILLVVLAVLLLAACVTLYATGYRLDDFIEDQPTTSSPIQSADKNNNKTTKKDDKNTSFTGTNSGTESSALEIPICIATKEPNKSHDDHEVHTYAGFELCYRESYEGAEWVAYHLTRDELNAVTDRTDDFRADTKITTGSATPDDYRGTGYDRGHLAPAADMEWSLEACQDSFLMSNMSPQAGAFNRGLWKTLEEQVRDWARIFDEVWIVTGPVFEKDAKKYKTIGKNKVAVPEYYYKVLLANAYEEDGYKSTISVAFILPNEKLSGSIWDYACSIDEVEERTGLDFFSLLPDDIESKLESTTDFEDWK